MFILARSLKLVIVHYLEIMPHYLIAMFIFLAVFGAIPLLGGIIALPLLVGVASLFTHVAKTREDYPGLPHMIGYRGDTLLRNVLNLGIPYIIFPFLGLVFWYTDWTTPAYWVAGQEWIPDIAWRPFENIIGVFALIPLIYLLPWYLFLTPLSMTPFLLADPEFDPERGSALKQSARMLIGSYLKLYLLRFTFLLWFIWLGGGALLAAVLFVAAVFGGEFSITGPFIAIYFITIPLTFLIILPWYHMLHALLYDNIRTKAKKKAAPLEDATAPSTAEGFSYD